MSLVCKWASDECLFREACPQVEVQSSFDKCEKTLKKLPFIPLSLSFSFALLIHHTS